MLRCLKDIIHHPFESKPCKQHTVGQITARHSFVCSRYSPVDRDSDCTTLSLDDFSADYLRVCANVDRRGYSLKGARQLSVTFIILNIGDGSRAER
jgi:hypothetical protein